MDCYTTEYVPTYYGHPNDPRNDGRLDDEVDAITELVSCYGMDPVEALKHVDWENPLAEEILELATQELIDNGDLPEDYEA